jgi:hypothetical protein|tara:strand:+ start:2597 stop:2890 length:294 start_codon:yes stop_codon:yes gene_type:complete
MGDHIFTYFNISLSLSPPTGPWSDFRISYHDNVMSAPWGKVKPSDVQLVHRYKWSAKEHESMYKILKGQNKTQDLYLSDLQSQLLDIIGEISQRTGN